jgi:hypothetical protein
MFIYNSISTLCLPTLLSYAELFNISVQKVLMYYNRQIGNVYNFLKVFLVLIF